MWYPVLWYPVLWYRVLWYCGLWYRVLWYRVLWYCGLWYCGTVYCGTMYALLTFPQTAPCHSENHNLNSTIKSGCLIQNCVTGDTKTRWHHSVVLCRVTRTGWLAGCITDRSSLSGRTQSPTYSQTGKDRNVLKMAVEGSSEMLTDYTASHPSRPQSYYSLPF